MTIDDRRRGNTAEQHFLMKPVTIENKSLVPQAQKDCANLTKLVKPQHE